MSRLIYYDSEKSRYSEEFAMKLSFEEGKRIAIKLNRHFKTKINDIRKTQGSIPRIRYWYSDIPNCWLILPKTTSFGIVCHEVAHALELVKYGKAGHNKKHTTNMKRAINYCRKKNFWRDDKEITIEGESK